MLKRFTVYNYFDLDEQKNKQKQNPKTNKINVLHDFWMTFSIILKANIQWVNKKYGLGNQTVHILRKAVYCDCWLCFKTNYQNFQNNILITDKGLRHIKKLSQREFKLNIYGNKMLSL